jgi:hypothetical protein
MPDLASAVQYAKERKGPLDCYTFSINDGKYAWHYGAGYGNLIGQNWIGKNKRNK